MNILNLIKNLIKRGKQTLNIDDTGDSQTAQVTFLGQTQTARQIIPYGLYSASPIDSDWIIFNLRANANDKAGIANNYKYRFKGTDGKGLKEGDVALYNQKTGNYLYFNSNKDTIEVCNNNKSITINEDLNVTVKNVTINASGDINITGGNVILGSSTIIDGKVFLDHNHDAGSYLDSVSGAVTGTSGNVV